MLKKNVLLLIVIAAFSGGSVAPFAKVALEVFHPFTLSVIRFLSASLVLLPFVYKNQELNFISLRKLLWVAVIGAFNPIVLFIALQFTPASISPLIYAVVPPMTAIYLRLFRNQEIPARQLVGIGVGFLGVAIIILLPFFQRGDVDLKSFWGNLLILGSAISFMLYGAYSKEKQQQYGVSPLALTFYFSVVCLLISIPFSVYEIIFMPAREAALEPKHVLAGLEAGVIGTSLFYLAYQKAIQQGNELTASLFTYLQPVATILFAVLLLGEAITLPFLVGGTLAIIGAGMASGKRLRRSMLPDPLSSTPA